MQPPVLTPSCAAFPEAGQWNRYLENPTTESALPDRIAFLSAACRSDASIEPMENVYETFLKANDLDAAVAAAASAIFMICNQGRDYNRLLKWDERLAILIPRNPGPSPPALSVAAGSRGFIQYMGTGNYLQAARLFKKAIFHADVARATNMKLRYSLLAGFCYLTMGDLSMLDINLFDIEPFMNMPEIPFFFKADCKVISAFVKRIRGEAAESKRMLETMIDHPQFHTLPEGYSLYFNSSLLESAIFDNDKPLIKDCFDKIQQIAIPAGNACNHAYLDFNFSLIHFALGEFEKAMRHAEEGHEKLKSTQSTPVMFSLELLIGQIMAEMRKDEETRSYFESRIPVWTRNGFHLFAATACFEMANLSLKKGEVDVARNDYEKGIRKLAAREYPVAVNRPAQFLEYLRSSLFPDSIHDLVECRFTDYRIRIETFGELRLHIGGHTVCDRQWKGRRAWLLLKALIVFGPSKVPMELLADLLWPDAEGDAAINSLRVTLCRLRKVGQSKSTPAVDWIKVKQGKVSLVKPLCDVDAVRFRECLNEARKQSDIELLTNILADLSG